MDIGNILHCIMQKIKKIIIIKATLVVVVVVDDELKLIEIDIPRKKEPNSRLFQL